MQRDPAGHYAVLDVDPAAPAAAVTAAYRRRAKLLHPDMPGTGDAEAFLRLQAAYQILGDPERRQAYDQSAGNQGEARKRPDWRQEAAELAFTPGLSWRPPRILGIALGVVTLLALGQVAVILLRPAPTPAARAFMVEASVPAAPARLLPGDAPVARRAACLYEAGPPLRGGQSLVHRGSGPVRVSVENRGDQPALFKLRNDEGMVAAAIYLAPRSSATIADFPAGTYRAEFAVGDLWSRACGMFMAGMRARRFPAAQTFSGAMHFVLPPADIPTTDIADEAFSRE